jgi:hypothetical protein
MWTDEGTDFNTHYVSYTDRQVQRTLDQPDEPQIRDEANTIEQAPPPAGGPCDNDTLIANRRSIPESLELLRYVSA